MSATKGNGLTLEQGQPVKTLSKRIADFIAAVACLTSIDVAFALLWLTIGAQLTLLIWEVLK